MSFVIVLSLFLGVLLGGIVFLLFGRRRWTALAATGVSLVGLLAWFLHPVCVPLTADDIARFSPPIESRTDTGLIGQAIFQQRDDRWFQWKVWIARAMFF